MKRGILLYLASLVCLVTVALAQPDRVHAAQFPTRPITVIIPYGTGGTMDLLARQIADFAARKHNINIVVQCKPGGSGAPAILDVAKAKPDGYTVGLSGIGALTLLPLTTKCGYTPDDFAFLLGVGSDPQIIYVSGKSDIKTFDDFIKKATDNPNGVNIASLGAVNTFQGLFIRILQSKFPNAQFPYVAYSTVSSVHSALLGGHISAFMMASATQKGFLESQDMRVIATASAKRLPEFPDVPTVAELTKSNMYQVSTWGFVAPKKTPKNVQEALDKLFKEALTDPELIQRMAGVGFVPQYSDSPSFLKVCKENMEMLAEGLKLMAQDKKQ